MGKANVKMIKSTGASAVTKEEGRRSPYVTQAHASFCFEEWNSKSLSRVRLFRDPMHGL